jgi:hypothetical protein
MNPPVEVAVISPRSGSRGSALLLVLVMLVAMTAAAIALMQARSSLPDWTGTPRDELLEMSLDACVDWLAFDALSTRWPPVPRPAGATGAAGAAGGDSLLSQTSAEGGGGAIPNGNSGGVDSSRGAGELAFPYPGAPELSGTARAAGLWMEVNCTATRGERSRSVRALVGTEPLFIESALRLSGAPVTPDGGEFQGEVAPGAEAILGRTRVWSWLPRGVLQQELRFWSDPTTANDALLGLQNLATDQALELCAGELACGNSGFRIAEGDLILRNRERTPFLLARLGALKVQGQVTLEGDFDLTDARILCTGAFHHEGALTGRRAVLFSEQVVELGEGSAFEASIVAMGGLILRGGELFGNTAVLLPAPGGPSVAGGDGDGDSTTAVSPGSGPALAPPPALWLSEGARLHGWSASLLPGGCKIERDTRVEGILLCEGTTQLEGSLLGHLTTRAMACGGRANTLEGHLLGDSLPPDVAQPPGLENYRSREGRPHLLDWRLEGER